MDYQSKLDQLWDQKIDQLEVKPDEFMNFQEVFRNHSHRSQIRGEAQRGGTILYKLVQDE